MAGGKKSGKLGLPSNGCLRYVVLYLFALLLLIGGIVATNGGLLSRFGVGSSSSSAGANSTINNLVLPANPAATTAPGNAAAANGLPANSGGSDPASGANQGAQLAILGAPVQSNQGSSVTPYIAPAFYIVQPNDTLSAIALTYGVTASQLMSYNNLSSDTIFAGQVLYLPPGSYQPVPATGRNAGNNDQP